MLKPSLFRRCAQRSTPDSDRQDKAAHIRLGHAGEEAAATLLLRAGFRLLDRNWRQGRLELDMVCRDGAELVFVEVKTRRSEAYGGSRNAGQASSPHARGPGLADGAPGLAQPLPF